MTEKKATPRYGNSDGVRGSVRTKSMIADAETFRVVMLTTAFTAVLLAVPTVMAATRQFGWWG